MIGIVTGMRSEAAVARAWSAQVACAGGDGAAATAAAQRLIADGATLLASVGIAGGLAPDLAPGALVLADRVIAPGATFEADAGWLAKLAAALPAARVGPVMGEDRIVARPAVKAALHRRHGALGVDLESGPVARVAAAAGIPFVVVRAIADRASSELPPAALVGLKPDGRVALGAVLASLARQPSQLRRLIAVARESRAALDALKAALPALRALGEP